MFSLHDEVDEVAEVAVFHRQVEVELRLEICNISDLEGSRTFSLQSRGMILIDVIVTDELTTFGWSLSLKRALHSFSCSN